MRTYACEGILAVGGFLRAQSLLDMFRYFVFLILQALMCLAFVNGFLTQPRSTFLLTGERQETRLEARRSTGGRAPGQIDQISSGEEWQPTPCEPGEARLTVIQITDTYTLENLASVKTLLADVRAKSTGSKVISMMTGDFLAPYLLSSVDRGQGMMNALARIPIDYISWGNHEVRRYYE
jgi:2',3'-cyclic-nucleotide 2'-phosphodiesterase (5'-nucleotidase family)